MLIRFLASAAALGTVISVSGCATVPRVLGAAAAEPEFSYGLGRGTQSFGAPLSAVIVAVNEAMGDLNITSIVPTREGPVARVEGTTEDRRRVVVMLHTNQGFTQVAVRAGWFGDEPLSQALLERVGIRLGTRSPESIPAKAAQLAVSEPFLLTRGRARLGDAPRFRRSALSRPGDPIAYQAKFVSQLRDVSDQACDDPGPEPQVKMHSLLLASPDRLSVIGSGSQSGVFALAPHWTG